jgi:hypothetical protein
VAQGTDVVIAQPVEDELELSSGGGHGADVAVAAAMSDLFADRADVTGYRAGSSPIRWPPTAPGASLAW